MRIGFSGTGGTGKTTTAKMLSQKLGIPLIPSPVREVYARHGIESEDAQKKVSAEKRYLLQQDIFTAIRKGILTQPEGIWDRTLLDNFFYLLFYSYTQITPSAILRCKEIMVESCKTFDHLFFFPLYGWPNVGDGMRTDHLAARMLGDSLLRDTIVQTGMPFYAMENKPVELRVESIIAHINGEHDIG